MIIDAIYTENGVDISLIDSARQEGASLFDLFDTPAASNVAASHQAKKSLDGGVDAMASVEQAVAEHLAATASTSAPAITLDSAPQASTSALPSEIPGPTLPEPSIPTPADNIPGLDTLTAEANMVEAETPVDAAAEATRLDDLTAAIRLVVLCRQHNPLWVKQQAKVKAKETVAKLAALPKDALIKIRTGGGVFEVRLKEILEATDSVRVMFEDGKLANYKFTAINWRPDTPVSRPQKADDYVYDGWVPTNRSRAPEPPRPAFSYPANPANNPRPPMYPPFAGPPAVAHAAVSAFPPYNPTATLVHPRMPGSPQQRF